MKISPTIYASRYSEFYEITLSFLGEQISKIGAFTAAQSLVICVLSCLKIFWLRCELAIDWPN